MHQILFHADKEGQGRSPHDILLSSRILLIMSLAHRRFESELRGDKCNVCVVELFLADIVRMSALIGWLWASHSQQAASSNRLRQRAASAASSVSRPAYRSRSSSMSSQRTQRPVGSRRSSSISSSQHSHHSSRATPSDVDSIIRDSGRVSLSWVEFYPYRDIYMGANIAYGMCGYHADTRVVNIANGEAVQLHDWLRLTEPARYSAANNTLYVTLGQVGSGPKAEPYSHNAEDRLRISTAVPIDQCRFFTSYGRLLGYTVRGYSGIEPVLDIVSGSAIHSDQLARIISEKAQLLEDSCHNALWVRFREVSSSGISSSRRCSSASESSTQTKDRSTITSL